MNACWHCLSKECYRYVVHVVLIYDMYRSPPMSSTHSTNHKGGFPSFARAFGEDFEVLRSQACLETNTRSPSNLPRAEPPRGTLNQISWLYTVPKALCRSRLGRNMPIGSQTFPVWAGRERGSGGWGGGGRNNSTLTRIHGCIPAVSVDEGKCECQIGVSRE